MIDGLQKELMLSPPLSALLDNEIKVCPVDAVSEAFEHILTLLDSYLVHRRLNAFGPTCGPMTSKTRMTSE